MNQGKVNLTASTAAAAMIIIVGFSLFGGLMDYSFLTAKIRVINYGGTGLFCTIATALLMP